MVSQKEKNDAMHGSQIYQKQIKVLRGGLERQKTEILQYRVIQRKVAVEREELLNSMNKQMEVLEKQKKFGKDCESIFDQMLKIDSMKE